MKPEPCSEKNHKKKKRKQADNWEIDPEGDHPVHEKYTKMEPVKEG
ncbi:hypothetical protein HZC30_07525 [Candidatus Woesearchaeota archaeon]|nr:hypothetical protein [Candidatus Woesearchaeota archaeon]